MARVITGIPTFSNRSTELHGMTFDGGASLLRGSYIRANALLSNAPRDFQPMHPEVCASCGKHLATVADKRHKVKDGDNWKMPAYSRYVKTWEETRLVVATKTGASNIWLCGDCSLDADKLRVTFLSKPEFAAFVTDGETNDLAAHIAGAWTMHRQRADFAKSHPGIMLGFGAHNPFPLKKADRTQFASDPMWPVSAYNARMQKRLASVKQPVAKPKAEPKKATKAKVVKEEAEA